MRLISRRTSSLRTAPGLTAWVLTHVLLLGSTGLLHASESADGGGGTTYYVATNGDDSVSCAQAQSQSPPRLTIDGGLACLSSGDTLKIKAGTYSGLNSDKIPNGTSWASPTTVMAFGDGAVNHQGAIGFQDKSYIVIDGLNVNGLNNQEVIWVGVGSHHIRIVNSDITNGAAHGIVSAVSGSGSNEFINNKIHDGGTPGVFHDVGFNAIYSLTPNTLIERNEIYRWADDSIQVYTGDANKTDNTIVRDNYIHHTSGNLNSSSCGQGIVLSDGDNLQAYGNIIANLFGDNSGCSMGIAVIGGANNAKVYNNTIYNSPVPAIQIFSGSNNTVVKNNIFWNNTSDIDDAGQGTIKSNNLCNAIAPGCSIASNPLFVDPANGNLQLQAGSPAIDAGATLGSPYNKDFDGVARPQGCCYDIGAYEYGGTPTPLPPVITSPSSAQGQIGQTFSYQITATNNPTSFGAVGLPSGLSINTSTDLISGTPTIAGTFSVTLSAINSAGTGSLTLTLTVTPVTSTGSVKVKRVGSDDTVNTAPSGTTAQVDSLPSSSLNPADFTSISTGSHAVTVTDVSGYTETAGTCTYTIGSAECTLSTFPLTPSCNGTTCSLPITVNANQFTKVVVKYTRVQ